MEKQRRKILLIAFALSLLFHAGLLELIYNGQWLIIDLETKNENQPEQVTIVFPENKPKQPPKTREVVQNRNFNNQKPDDTSLLSDQNSRAKNPEFNGRKGDMPQSAGNSPLANLSSRPSKEFRRPFQQKRFSAKALRGESSRAPQTASLLKPAKQAASRLSRGNNNWMNQKDFSVEELGALTLSTYQWDWAPYVNAMRDKLIHVWIAPPAYYQLGLISGYTIIRYTVNRKGELVGYEVLKHRGHDSLKRSSVQAIESLFPFNPLPDDFPDPTLTIIAKLIYPDVRNRR
ncbi:MAG TPA: hypothetical protein ENJ89_08140 [Caldithrix abyssi]|uniref:TonB C-terminal domain-containing protein n=1 Tax=Caldithrix abyssi TaxID=187145 RepID=A0A7V5PQ06_CALAY|nr:hypothetical protein [Caldithrix abyssi]